MKDLEKLSKELENYNNKDISINFSGSLRFSTLIHNAKCMVTQKILLIGNFEYTNEEIEIGIDDIEKINIDKDIIIEMNGNYTIYMSK